MKLPFVFLASFLALGTLQGAAVSARLANGVARLTAFADGSFEIREQSAGTSWRSVYPRPRFGLAEVIWDGKPRKVELSGPEFSMAGQSLIATFHPLENQSSAVIRLRIQSLKEDGAFEVSYTAEGGLRVEHIALFEEMLAVSEKADGYLVVPVREGLKIPARSGINFTHRFDTSAYEGCHMQMMGLVRNGAAVMVTWDDPYVALDVKSTPSRTNDLSPGQTLSAAISLRKSATAFRITFLGKGDYVSIGKAYRAVADAKGLRVTWDTKLKTHPEDAKLFGAANIKLWSALDRRMNEDSTKEESVRVNWTFPEAAQVAEHLKNDLQLDRVLFTVGGWIHRGYDNQHPDILPAAPECGGDASLADCARRVMDLGYLFCLHDNYQDIYKDSPSWDERFIMKTGDGKIARGGHWAGGMAYLTCSRKALELAQRPQNLEAVKKLTRANSYFIDTTYAAGLQECFDSAHPLARGDDMKWKKELSDYSRGVFGVFGSECGREWAIPHSDFFEGLTGVSGGYYHDANLVKKLGATVIPLFEIVYRDCIAMYGKYGFEPARAADYVLHHLVIGRPLNYHSMPPHLYWTKAGEDAGRLPLRPSVASVKPIGPRSFEITYGWEVTKPVRGAWRAFVHFTDASGAIKFQDDYQPAPAVAEWKSGKLTQGPFRVTVPEGLNGTFNVRLGLFEPDSGARALLQGRDNGERSYLAGRLKVSGDQMEFLPASSPPDDSGAGDPGLFVRGENGWTSGLHPMDRFIKNTCEVLGPLNEITARVLLEEHRFLSADQKVQRSVFGKSRNAVTVTVNQGSLDFEVSSSLGGPVILPPGGFLIESPAFVGFYARNWGQIRYETGAMFTLRSLDTKPLARSNRIRVFHAFGENQIQVQKAVHRVEREQLISR
jgi:hypothetical protein